MQNVCRVGLMFTIGCFCLTGCVTAPVNPMATPEWDAAEAPYPESTSAVRKVVLVNFNNNDSADAKATNAAGILEQEVKSLLSTGGAEIIDRSLVSGLRDEIIQLEKNGVSSYTTSLATDAISADITGINIKSSFSPASSYTNNGQTHRSPARCNYQIEARILFQIYNLQPLRRTEAINAVGTSSEKLTINSANCPIPAATRKAWVAAALGDSIQGGKQSAKKELQTAFAKVGYVQQVRMDKTTGAPGLVRISLNAGQGARVGAEVGFFSRKETIVYGKGTEMSLELVAKGVVVESTDPVNAWVKVKDRSQVQGIHLGDQAKLQYKDPRFEIPKIIPRIPFINP
jgi:hypothetical protein